MKKYILLSFLLLSTLSGIAQNNAKYLAGAVPVIDNKVTFTETFANPRLTSGQMFDKLLAWAQNRFKSEEKNWGRVIYSNREKGQIACQGEEYITFSERTLSLDRAKIKFRLIFMLTGDTCNLEISNIHYIYGEKDEKITAEEYITDQYALNKDQTKLAYGTKKFRIKTIDLVEELESEVRKVLDTKVTAAAQSLASQVSDLPQNSFDPEVKAELQGYRRIDPDKIPGNIIKLLADDWMLITANEGNDFNMMTASWGGLGHLYGKPVAFCFINPSRHTYQLMEKGETYTWSFYTETYRDALKYCGSHSGKDENKVKGSQLTPLTTPTGSKAFEEAWMIIECRKMVSQAFTPEALFDEKLKKEWEGKALHKMYIGEITNVWVK